MSWTMSLAERCVQGVRGLILYLRVLRGEFRRRRESVIEHRCRPTLDFRIESELQAILSTSVLGDNLGR